MLPQKCYLSSPNSKVDCPELYSETAVTTCVHCAVYIVTWACEMLKDDTLQQVIRLTWCGPSTLLLTGWADSRSYHKRQDVIKHRGDLIGCSTAYDNNFAPTFWRNVRTNLVFCAQSSNTSSRL